MPDPRRYAAFISYSHSDEVFAARLHKAIEGWRTPRRLTGTEGRDGEVPARLFPVFRDREELPTSADLGGVIRAALEGSRYLIVLCSPRAAQSKWVGQEILQFKQMHGEGRIIAALIEGDPAEAFPEAMRYRLGPDGALSGEEAEPIAADFRPGKDGWRLGLMKILAGVLGVNLDDLVRRETRRRRMRALAAAGLAALALAGAGLGLSALQEREERQAAVALADRGLSDLRSRAPFSGAARFLTAVEALGDAAGEDRERLASALRARLVSYSEAVAELEDGVVTSWRDGAYLARDGGLVPVAGADVYAHLGERLLLSRRGEGVAAWRPGAEAPDWRAPFEEGESICALWREEDTGRVYFEAEYIGMTIGASYGFHGWIDVNTGEADHLGYTVLHESACMDEEAAPSVEGRFTRIDRTVGAFDWPRMRREPLMWDYADFMARPPYAAAAERRGAWDGFGIVDGAETPMRALFSWGPPLVAQCGDRRLTFGLESAGNAGGQWLLCEGSEPATCEAIGYAGIVHDYLAAPDCGHVAAVGAGLSERRGLTIVGADRKERKIRWTSAPRATALGVWSAGGGRFAATNGGGRIFVLEVGAAGADQIAVHEAGEPVGALAFLADHGLAFVTESGSLRGIDAVTGDALWPPIAVGPRIGLALTDRDSFEDPASGKLLADPEGRMLALVVQMEAAEAYKAAPDTQPTTMDGRLAEPEPGRHTGLALFFDARLGAPVGRVMPLGWVTGPDPANDHWDEAHLSPGPDGALVLSFEPYASFVLKPEPQVTSDPIRLTGFAAGGPLRRLPPRAPSP